MNMAHAAFALTLSAVYFGISIIDSGVAQALTIAFVALVLLPAFPSFMRRHRGARRRP